MLFHSNPECSQLSILFFWEAIGLFGYLEPAVPLHRNQDCNDRLHCETCYRFNEKSEHSQRKSQHFPTSTPSDSSKPNRNPPARPHDDSSECVFWWCSVHNFDPFITQTSVPKMCCSTHNSECSCQQFLSTFLLLRSDRVVWMLATIYRDINWLFWALFWKMHFLKNIKIAAFSRDRPINEYPCLRTRSAIVCRNLQVRILLFSCRC